MGPSQVVSSHFQVVGATHFTLKTLERVGTGMSVQVLAYNIKRVLKILGVQPLLEGMHGQSPLSLCARQYSCPQGSLSDKRSVRTTNWTVSNFAVEASLREVVEMNPRGGGVFTQRLPVAFMAPY